jgi:hypothetical protein
MENAEKIKKLKLRRWLCCGYNLDTHIVDPRKMNSFIESVMDPYSREDKILREKEINNKKNKKQNKQSFDQIWKEIKKTNNVLKENVCLTEQLYNKVEKGELNTMITLNKNKNKNVIKLFDSTIDKGNNIKLLFDDDNFSDNNDKERRSRNNSDSSNSLMDIDVVCENNEDTNKYSNLNSNSNSTTNLKELNV